MRIGTILAMMAVLGFPLVVSGQCIVREYGWTNAVGGEDYDILWGVVSDTSGRVYVTGAFHDTVDFRPDKRRDRHTNRGDDALFLSSYDGDGRYRWTISLSKGGASIGGAGLALSPTGDILVTGGIEGKVDFRPGPGRSTVKSYDDADDAFVALYNDKGVHRWTRVFRGPGSDVGRAVAVDRWGHILVTGNYSEWTDFDPGPGEDIQRTEGNTSAFVTRLTPDGSLAWARTFPGDWTDFGQGIAAGPEGEAVAVGTFSGETDFDPSEGRDLRRTAGESDVFAVKLNAQGDREWAYTIGGVYYDFVHDVAIDEDGNAYLVGSFFSTVDFDPEGGGDVREADDFDAFLVKLAADGSVVWVRVVTGPGSASAHGVALRADGALAVSGSFSGVADFDPGEGVDERTAKKPWGDVFVVFLTTEGDYVGVDVMGGTDSETGRSVSFDPEGNLLVAGTFRSLDCDFDPTTGVDIRSATTDDDPDVFTTKLYCGSCQYVERHTIVLPEKRTLKGEVRALVPGGRVTVECTPTDPPGEPVETPVRIKDDNTGKYTLTKLDKGEYACAITEVRDADGKVVCDEPAGKRTVTVK